MNISETFSPARAHGDNKPPYSRITVPFGYEGYALRNA